MHCRDPITVLALHKKATMPGIRSDLYERVAKVQRLVDHLGAQASGYHFKARALKLHQGTMETP